MAKYKYDVYEVGTDYYTDTIYGTERKEYFKKYTRQVSVYKFYSSNGTFSYYGSVNVEYSQGYYYELNGSYYKITDSLFSGGGSRGYGWIELIKVRVMSSLARGSFIESIVADENAYPTNGTKDGKWYVRKEIIQEHKISFKDSEGKLLNIASIYFKDSNSNICNIGKAYSDEKLVWEKRAKELGTLVYYDTGSSKYDISVNGWSKVNPNKNYKFVTTKADNEYSIIVSGSYMTIKNNDIFRITRNCDMQIKNLNYNYYDIKIYEVKEEATIII